MLSPNEVTPNAMRHKFRDLRVYASTEWLADNKKKYRQVFDRYETSYVYAELSFYNKSFDIDDWDVTISIKCFSLKKGRKELCDLQFERKVSKYDHIFYLREGWGNKKIGAFWKRGTYFWEAYIDGIKVATKYFYIEDTGNTFLSHDNYMRLRSVKLYEGPFDDLPVEERRYYRTFSDQETRYIYTELQLENLQKENAWYAEVLVKFYNGARELKGQTIRLQRIEKDVDTFEITANWGSNIKGSWKLDEYTAEVIFMDKLLAVMPFSVASHFEEGNVGVFLPGQANPLLQPIITDEDGETFEAVIQKLDDLVGLTAVKNKIREHAEYINFINLRRMKGFKEEGELSIHTVFMGNPGTGKTTVAKMLGRLYKKMGLLSRGHLHEVDRTDIIGEYIGQTAPKVRDAIEKARGGVLFIDEAYALARQGDDGKDFGREVIELLVKEMSGEGNRDLAIVVAGYPKEMTSFLDSNPGLRSRFKVMFEFPDYLPQELLRIADYSASRKEVRFSKEARERLHELLTGAYRKRNRTFGNARYVNDVLDQAKINLALRVMRQPLPSALGRDELDLLLPEDFNFIDAAKPLPQIPINNKELDAALLELDALVGMARMKADIHETVKLVRFYREVGRDVLGQFHLHTVLVGNPGTGKTTVARILTKLYKALGILERGHLVETDRQGLVAGFVGQTAIKTTEKLDEALGGVLFVDEAYALADANNRAGGDFGSEAIQTILKRMEDRRGEFFVMVAGYPSNMEAFMKANPGLRSRFDKTLRFDDYLPEELFDIALQMLAQDRLIATEEAQVYLKQYFQFLYDYRDRYFGNARAVRQSIKDLVKQHTLRLSLISAENRTPEVLGTVTLLDVQSLKMDKNAERLDTNKSIGF